MFSSSLAAKNQVDIKEVRDNILVLSKDRYRVVLTVSSINFELQSDAEQDVLIDLFQNFLNSLTAPVQILTRIRELDLDRYLDNLTIPKDKNKSTVYQKQLSGYRDFVKELVAGNKILSRRFYLVLPIDSNSRAGFEFIKEQAALEQEIVIKGLEKLGINVRVLSGLEILELFYSFYRPDAAKTQPLTNELFRKANELDFL